MNELKESKAHLADEVKRMNDGISSMRSDLASLQVLSLSLSLTFHRTHCTHLCTSVFVCVCVCRVNWMALMKYAAA